MKVTLWGTRGSVAAPGPDTARYGGNTPCVEVRGDNGQMLILDAGSGIRRLGTTVPAEIGRLDIMLTHLHLDHILGLGFFGPLHNPNLEVNIWGPASTTMSLGRRLMRYLSPPYFPLHLNELPCKLSLHEVASGTLVAQGFEVSFDLVCHPGPTVAYRVVSPGGSIITYIPDHEPALGVEPFPLSPDWTSGYDLAHGADLLIHDSQYTDEEYEERMGWGHSTLAHALAYAELVEAKQFVTFHYDPSHDDAKLDSRFAESRARKDLPFRFSPGMEGDTFELP